MANQWFRMYSDFLEDAKIVSLAFEDQRHFIGVLALKSAGLLDQECAAEVMDRLVAQKLWVDRSSIVEVKRRLVEVGLIEPNWQPIAWDKRQFISDHDPTAADRQRRWRDRKRNGSVTRDSNEGVTDGVTHNVTDASHRPDTDTDTDKKEAKASLSELADATSDRAGDGGDYSPEKPGIPPCPHQDIIALYHQILPELPSVIPSRWPGSEGESQLRTRWREDPRHRDLAFWDSFFRTVRTSRHWMGENDREWRADLRWLIRRKNFDKAVERMVDNLNRGREG
jgi:hypothetical protein